ncbi:MAG: tryptophan-rich sensory protein [Aggregatilineales bacterium]
MTKNIRFWQIASALALLITLIMNGVSQSPDLFPQTIGDLGESRAIFFLPAGYVFSIWGIIYTGLIGFAIYQVRNISIEKGIHERIGVWFVLSCIANVTWLILFLSNEVWLSTIAMLVILVSLIMIYRNLGIGVREIDWQERWAVHIPFSIYLGWISVATVANFSTGLYESGFVTEFVGLNADIWAVAMMVVAGILALGFLVFRRDIAYALVIVWALVGIYARPFDTEIYELLAALNSDLVNTGALVVAGLVALVIVVRIATIFIGDKDDSPQRQTVPA